jgi:hypothetical protein
MNRGVLLSSFLGHKGRSAHPDLMAACGLRVGEAVNKTLPFMGAKTNGATN